MRAEVVIVRESISREKTFAGGRISEGELLTAFFCFACVRLNFVREDPLSLYVEKK